MPNTVLVPTRYCLPSHSPGMKFYKEILHSKNIVPITQDENINISHSGNDHGTCTARNVTWHLVDVPCTAMVQE
jgi:hypothetical protein